MILSKVGSLCLITKKEKRTEEIATWTSCISHKFRFYLVFGRGKTRPETESVMFKMAYDFIYQRLVFTSRQQK